MRIYIDVLFLVGFFMNAAVFKAASCISGNRVKNLRIALGGALASGLYCILLYFGYVFGGSFLWAAFILAISIAFVFRPKDCIEFFKLMLISFFSSMAIGGACVMMFYFTNSFGIIGNFPSLRIGNFPAKLLFVSVSVIYIALKAGSGWINNNIISRKPYCGIKLYFNERAVTAKALIDTGNELHDNEENNYIVIADFGVIKELMPFNMQLIFLKGSDQRAEAVYSELLKTDDFSKNIRLIKFSSLGNKNGRMLALRLDKLEIFQDKADAEALTVKNILAAVNFGRLSVNDSYNAIINPQILKQEVV